LGRRGGALDRDLFATRWPDETKTRHRFLRFILFQRLLAIGRSTMAVQSRQSVLFLAALICALGMAAALSPPYFCPTECNCYFKKNNWVTDCSDIKLTSIPMKELPAYLFELNMNGNLLKKIEPFPSDVSVRSLRLSRNFLTEIHRKTFAGLDSLLEIDLSHNNINFIDPLAFV